MDGHRLIDHQQTAIVVTATNASFKGIQARPSDRLSLGQGGAELLTNASGTATGAGQTTTTLQDTSKTWTADAYKGHLVVTTGGTGSGQVRYISTNNANTLTIETLFETTPVAASTTYEIRRPSDAAFPIMRAFNVFHQAGTAASVVVQGVSYSGTTKVTDTLYRYDPAASATSGQVSEVIIRKARPGAEIRVVTSASGGTPTFTGSFSLDGYYQNDFTSGAGVDAEIVH